MSAVTCRSACPHRSRPCGEVSGSMQAFCFVLGSFTFVWNIHVWSVPIFWEVSEVLRTFCLCNLELILVICLRISPKWERSQKWEPLLSLELKLKENLSPILLGLLFFLKPALVRCNLHAITFTGFNLQLQWGFYKFTELCKHYYSPTLEYFLSPPEISWNHIRY